jgi:glyoxylase-like metal-dependent hydrolase (beta-lactamase superfamily II)
MHLDHIGGLPDFPNAKVHIYAEEYQGITSPHTLEEKYICRREHWAHSSDWVIHHLGSEEWNGFKRTPEVQLGDLIFFFVPLPGHTRGHSAVVLRSQDGWLMHCGDAYVYHGDVDPDGPHYPPRHKSALKIMGLFSQAFRVLGMHSHRLRRLRKEHGECVRIFCSHDALEFKTLAKSHENQPHSKEEFSHKFKDPEVLA